MADWKSRGGGRKAGQSIGTFSGGAGMGGGVPSSHNRDVKGEGGPGHGQGRPGSQPSLQAAASFAEAARSFAFKAAVDFGETTRSFKVGNSAGSGLDRAGSSIKSSSGENSPRVADPEGAFVFGLIINNTEVAQFKECSGLKSSTAIVEIEEGGQNHRVHKMPGQSRWENISLKYGTTSDTSLLAWRNEILNDEFSKEKRRNGAVVMYNLQMQEVRRFNFISAWPVSWEGPSLNADGADIAIETIVLAHHGITVS
jgi:phage tail-like protein